jgi:glycosyltransferase involved in cell wall biosynthesis
MSALEIIFWMCAACVAYTYLGYPLCLAVRACWRPAPVRRGPFRGRVTILFAVRNEEAAIERRVQELSRHLRESEVPGELVVVSDGSNDGTVEILRAWERKGMIRVLEFAKSLGKAAAITRAARSATGDVLVFADARQTWAEDALSRLLENFADPTVGAVSGDLVLEAAPGMLLGVGIYWRFEKWLRRKESITASQVGVTGAISAVRRVLFRPIPAGTLLDDVYWPLCVALEGWRVVHDERARAYDRLPAASRDEYLRKIRTLAGNYQLAARLPATLLPWRNPLWWSWVSHKLLRLVVPWALLTLYFSSRFLPGPLYQTAFWSQLAAYGVGVLGTTPYVARKSKLLAAAGSFLVLNAAAWLAFWVWAFGRTESSWTKARYVPQLEPASVLGGARPSYGPKWQASAAPRG